MNPPGNEPSQKDDRTSRNQTDILFEHQGREIRFLFSLYSGREQVFVDNHLVSDRRSWRFRNQHEFEAGGVHYVLEVDMKKNLRDIVLGVIDIRLLANGALVDSDRFNGARYILDGAANNRKLTGRAWLFLFACSLVGAIAGFAVGYFALDHFL